ncbi:transposase family protein [Bordetella holmesii 70147]|nr:transposase family protein [Bordetella holmesii 70147]
MAKYGREVIDRVRVDQANQLRHDKPARRVIKSSRWLLLRNRKNLDPCQSVKLDELLQANQPLLTAYLMRDELKQLWFYQHPGYAARHGITGCNRLRAAASPPWLTSRSS